MRTRSLLQSLALGALFSLSACTTVMYVRNPQSRIYTDPVYESSRPFFFFGLVGKEQNIYVDDICLGKDVDQLATQYTPANIGIGILTLGLYSPRTVQIWCQL